MWLQRWRRLVTVLKKRVRTEGFADRPVLCAHSYLHHIRTPSQLYVLISSITLKESRFKTESIRQKYNSQNCQVRKLLQSIHPKTTLRDETGISGLYLSWVICHLHLKHWCCVLSFVWKRTLIVVQKPMAEIQIPLPKFHTSKDCF